VTIGNNLRSARRHLRLSQASVAELLGTTRQAIAAFEKDKRAPDIRQLVGMANLFRLTPDELVGGALSALVPLPAAPSVLPRFNTAKGLDDQDRCELQEFEQYLRCRPPVQACSFVRRPLETVQDTVTRLREECGVKDVAPVPIFALTSKLGIELRFTVLGELAGALLRSVEGHPAGILVNSDQPFERQRFSAAHELGHQVLGHRPKEDFFVSFLGRRFDPTEVDADNFAAELLTPTDLLQQKVKTVVDKSVDEAVYRLARDFAVSFQAMTLRLSKLGALHPDQISLLESTKPTDLAKRIASDGKKSPFNPSWLPLVARQSLPSGWQKQAGPDTVRTLQESAYLHYLTEVPEGSTADSAGRVYEHVARWVANTYPIVRAA